MKLIKAFLHRGRHRKPLFRTNWARDFWMVWR